MHGMHEDKGLVCFYDRNGCMGWREGGCFCVRVSVMYHLPMVQLKEDKGGSRNRLIDRFREGLREK